LPKKRPKSSIEAVRGRRTAVVQESVDLIYNLAVLWSELGIAASEVWAEMDRRQALLGMAEKLPKDGEETAVEQNHSLQR
jgi:phosphoribosyl-ATP pyrophosphohydrolase